MCSVLEEDGTETHFDELGESPVPQTSYRAKLAAQTCGLSSESVFLLEAEQPKALLLFGVFTSTR